MKKPYLFDSFALLALFQGDSRAGAVVSLLKESIESDRKRMLHIINLGEIIYLTKRRFGDQKKIEVLGRIHSMGISILSVCDRLVFQAAEYKALYPMSYADCFALAAAIDEDAILVTGDPEFRHVQHLIDIEWI